MKQHRLRLTPTEARLIYSKRKPNGNFKPEKQDFPKILVLDIETALMTVQTFHSAEQRIPQHMIVKDWFVICWAAKWLFSNETMSDCCTSKEAVVENDQNVINSAWQLLDKADIVITHNGRRFDHRKLNARFIYYGLARPSHYLTIDTLKATQKQFATSSHKQDYLTKYLKLPEKLKTDIDLWKECSKGNKQALKRMVKYCRGDVRGLEELYLTIRAWIDNHPNLPLYTDFEGDSCPNCMSENIKKGGYYYTPTGKYETFRCECGAFGKSRKAEKRKISSKVC